MTQSVNFPDSKYKCLFENSLDGIMLTMPDGTIQGANPAACQMFGMTEEEICAAGRSTLVVDSPELERLLAERQLTGKSQGEVTYRRKDGSTFPGEASSVVLEDGSSFVIIRDITARKATAETLRQSEEKFRIMGEILPYGVWLCNAEGKAEYVSPSFLDLLNMTVEEQKGFGWSKRLVPEDVPGMMERWMECVRTGKEWDSEHRIIDRYGDIKTILTRGRPVLDKEGNITGWAGINLDITERKQAEAELMEAKKRASFFANAVENCSLAFGIGYPDGRLSLVNKAFTALTGYTDQELAMKHWGEDLTPPEWRDHEAERLEELHRTGIPQTYEKEYIRKDGTRVSVEMNVHLVRTKDGDVDYYYSFVTDITARKRAEENIRRAAEQRQLALDAAKMGWWHYSPTSGTLTYDERCSEILGLSGENCDITLLQSRIPPEDLLQILPRVDAAMDSANRQPFFAEHRVIQQDGTLRWVEAHGIATFEGRGPTCEVSTFVGTVRDITARKDAEEALRQAYAQIEKVVEERTTDLQEKKALLKTVLEALPVGVAIFDRNGTVTYLNPTVRELWGDQRFVEASQYIQYKAWHHGTDRLLAAEDHTAAIALVTRQPATGSLIDIETFAGKRKVVISSAAPFFDDQGEVKGVVGVMEDITEQQELQKQLLHVQKLESIGSLAGGVAHDFNNLLMSICGFAQIAYEDAADDDIRASIQQVLAAGESARQLTQKLLAVSRQQVTETKVISLTECIHNVMKLTSRGLREDIEIHTALTCPPLNIKGNCSQLEQVLMNLIINAGDAMPDGGTLTIAAGKTSASEPRLPAANEAWAFIKISDTGTGIPKAVIDKIFDPYFTTKEVGKGTGLGLSIAYGILQQHGGKIFVESEEGQGTTFTLFFPLTDHDEQEHTPVPVEKLPGGAETVLVVEDDDMVKKYVTLVLRRAGYSVLSASSGDEAIACIADHPVDLLLCDIIMPRMNGIEAYDRMKAIRPGLRGLLMSGYSSDILKIPEVASRQLKFLQKPVLRNELLRAVRDVLDA